MFCLTSDSGYQGAIVLLHEVGCRHMHGKPIEISLCPWDWHLHSFLLHGLWRQWQPVWLLGPVSVCVWRQHKHRHRYVMTVLFVLFVFVLYLSTLVLLCFFFIDSNANCSQCVFDSVSTILQHLYLLPLSTRPPAVPLVLQSSNNIRPHHWLRHVCVHPAGLALTHTVTWLFRKWVQ